MSLFLNINKENLHHAYLLEGERDLVVPEILNFLTEIGFHTANNPDYYQAFEDTFKIESARTLKSLLDSKSFNGGKKVFVLSANSILREAQNSLLKVFEEPQPDTHFFLIVPTKDILLPTFLSRFYVLGSGVPHDGTLEAQKFLSMPLQGKLDFIKDLVKAVDEDEEPSANSPRTKAISFLNNLELALYQNQKAPKANIDIFEHIFKTREYLRQSGSAPKMLLESVALLIPYKI